MLKHNYDRSFIAHVACTTPGYEGYLDCAKLAIQDGHAARADDDWMIVTSILGREPHYFWFRCFLKESTGRPYYNIQSWSRRTGRNFNVPNRHLDCSYNGYPGLYPQAPDDSRLWKVITLQEGSYASMTTVVEVGQQIEARITTRSNLELQALEREEVGEHWYAPACTNGGQVLDLRLDITHIGEELLDDH